MRELDRLIRFIQQGVREWGADGAVVGISGGLDSAVVAALAARALAPELVLGILMPERDSDPRSLSNARALCRALGIRYRVIGITRLLRRVGTYSLVPWAGWLAPHRLKARYSRKRFERLSHRLRPTPFLYTLSGVRDPELCSAAAYYRIKHRLRMVLLYYYAELNNYLVLGCLNRSELLTGLFVRYGDGACDLAPLLGLYKTQVRELAQHLGLPRSIMEQPPSPDLIPGLTDEEILGLDYPVLDRILAGIEAGDETGEIARKVGISRERVGYVAELVKRSSRMRAAPISIAIGDSRPEGLPYGGGKPDR